MQYENPYTQDVMNTYLEQVKEKNSIKTIGVVSGICVVAAVMVQNILSLPVFFKETLNDLYLNDELFGNALNIFLSVIGLLLPFLIGGLYLKKKTNTEIFEFQKPNDDILAFLSVPFGMFVCLTANYITTWIMIFTQSIGFKLTSPEMTVPESFSGRLLYIVSIAVVPALTEEMAIRGCIMQPLRKHGDRFAIIASSFVFAILHGNFIQAPFAFIVGLGLGYICCITDSLWPPIVIHFVNNLYSAIISFLQEDIKDAKTFSTVFNMIFIFLSVIGVFCAIVFFFRKGNKRLNYVKSYLPERAKYQTFIFNVPMMIAIIVMLFITANYVKRV